MRWRKWNRWLHRELGYIFFGMTIIYGISGIALNHHVARHWNPDLISRSESFKIEIPDNRDQIDKTFIKNLLDNLGETENYKQYYFPSDSALMIYLKSGHISLNLDSGEGSVVKVKNRPVFRELDYLHYNKPKKAWTWFSDIFAFSLILMAITGLFMVKGRKGISGRGGVLLVISLIIPLLFLIIYLWT